MATHTPGTWHAGGSLITGPDSRYVALVLQGMVSDGRNCPDYNYVATNDLREHELNASLIAAAPDLLEQLVRVLAQWKEFGIVGPTVYAYAEAAIVRATYSPE